MTNNLINLGTFTAPYREFEFSITPNGIHKLVYDHQLIEILENNLPDNVTCCFGGVGGFTKLEQGIMYRYPDNNIIPYVQFKNEDAVNTATLRVAVAVGEMKDNRLTVSGNVTVQSNQDNPLFTYNDVYNQTPLSTKLTVSPSGIIQFGAWTGNNLKKILIQNTSNANLRLGSTDGFIIPPLGTFVWEVPNKTIYIYGTQGQTVYIMGFK